MFINRLLNLFMNLRAVIVIFAFLVFGVFSLSACTPLIVGTTATAVVATSMQERNVGTIIDDKGLWLKIKNALASNKLSRGINISVDEGRVLLTGNTESSADRIRVAKIVWEQPGVREVMNEIELANRELSFAKSAWITAQIKTKLLLKSSLKSFNYTVETNNGIVYLLGIAKNKTELNEVMSLARRTEGVRHVVSYVRLKNSPLRIQ